MILVNGDSWTGGPTYPNLEDHWPYQMAKKYKLDVHNLAWGGASNQRIFRTTIEWLYQTDKLPSHLVIGWTIKERFELPSIKGLYCRITPNDGCENFIENNKPVPGIAKIKNYYYRYSHNERLAQTAFEHNILILQDLCKLKGIKLMMFNSRQEDAKLLDNLLIDETVWILNPRECMADQLEKQFGHIKSGHTSVEGQHHWADFVYNCM